jgi:hypothetical protein
MTSPVSPGTERRLREAMARLFNGEPVRTDGKLTKNNLWREAEVSRATMNRAAAVVAEWDSRVGDSPAGAAARERDEELDDLRSRLNGSRRECRSLQDRVDAASTVIAALMAENAVLRSRASRLGVVVPIEQGERSSW